MPTDEKYQEELEQVINIYLRIYNVASNFNMHAVCMQFGFCHQIHLVYLKYNWIVFPERYYSVPYTN